MCYTAHTKQNGSAGRSAREINPLDSAHSAEVRAQLDQLLAVPAFTSSRRRGRLLRYLVEHSLAGEADGINEYAIGVDVFDKPPSFDPRIESIVRTEAGRLRQKLREYYAAEGSGNRVSIEIPLRSYKPVFSFREAEVSRPAPGLRQPRIGALFAGLALIVVCGAMAAWMWQIRAHHAIRSLVVLPFRDFSPGGSDEYLSDGLTDELTNEFANWKDLRVVARTSAYQYKGRGEDVRKIGRELNVDAVLEGSLAKEGDHIRITAQLNRASDGYHLWSQSYDTRSLDMLNVQREIAQAIAAAVRKLGGKASDRVKRPSTGNPEALDLYLRASYEYSRLNVASLAESVRLFQGAILKDPAYARAYIGLAMAEMELSNFVHSPQASVQPRALVAQALKLDPDSGDAHWLLAEFAENDDWDWPRAEREFQLAVEKGGQASARAAYGWSLARYGRFAEAQPQCAAAENLEPLGVAPRFCQFYVYYYQRQYPQARKMLEETLQLNPDLIYAHVLLGRIALAGKDCVEAARQFDWSGSKLPAPAATLAAAYECACRGETKRARRYIEEAGASVPPPVLYEMALGYALLGDKDAAIAYLQKSAAARENLPVILDEPAFDPIRGDPRFVALKKMAGFER